MDLTSYANNFDLFVDCYVYASIAIVLILFMSRLIEAWLDLIEEHRTVKGTKSDFYEQVKALMEQPSEPMKQPLATMAIDSY